MHTDDIIHVPRIIVEKFTNFIGAGIKLGPPRGNKIDRDTLSYCGQRSNRDKAHCVNIGFGCLALREKKMRFFQTNPHLHL